MKSTIIISLILCACALNWPGSAVGVLAVGMTVAWFSMRGRGSA